MRKATSSKTVSRGRVIAHLVQVVGFTSGLQPFGPTYVFADYDTALLGRVDRDPNNVLVGVAAGADPDVVAARLEVVVALDATPPVPVGIRVEGFIGRSP